MRLLTIIIAAIGVTSFLSAEPSKPSEPSPKDKLLKWIDEHHIPEKIDVKNVKTGIPNNYIICDPAIRRSFSEFLEWMGIPKDNARVSVGMNMGLFRSLDITDEYILILFMHYGGTDDKSLVLRGLVIRQVDDKELSNILTGLMGSSTKWKTAIPKEAQQAGAGQPATASESKPEGGEKPKPESVPAPR